MGRQRWEGDGGGKSGEGGVDGGTRLSDEERGAGVEGIG